MIVTEDRVLLEPVVETPSDTIIVPERQSRFGKHRTLSICGKVVAVGPKVQDVEIGEYAYHSDSCYHPINDGSFNVIRQDDIMFLSKELVSAQWIGAEERYRE